MILMFYILIAIYLMVRGGGEAEFWPRNSFLEGLLMLGSGLFLFLEWIM